MQSRQVAVIGKNCCFCGACFYNCPQKAVSFSKKTGYAVEIEKCVGCRICALVCRAHSITFEEQSK